MKTLNRATVMGYLGKDAETRYTPSGSAVTEFSIATTEKWKDKATGEDRERTDWHNCVLWGAETLVQYLTKGLPVLVEGRLQTQTWEKPDGSKGYKTQIVVDSIHLLNRGQRSARDEDAPPPRNRGDLNPPTRDGDVPVPGDDDVPF